MCSTRPCRDADWRVLVPSRRTARRIDEADHALRGLLASTRLVNALGPDEYATLIENAKAEQGRARLEYAETRNRSESIDGFVGDMLGARPGLTPNEKRQVMTAHTFVATEAGPCVILATGNRRDDHERMYPRSEVALRYHAGSDVDTTEPERRGSWEVRRPSCWAELPWAERP